MHRRHLLCGLVAGVPLFAGCNMLTGGGNGGESGTGTEGGETTQAASVTETATATATRVTTAAATATATSTPTPPATATALPSATATDADGTQSGTAMEPTARTDTSGRTTGGATPGAGAVSIDPSELTTYESDAYPYSVERPADWTVDASDPTQVVFEPAGGLAQEQALVIEDVGDVGLDAFVSLFNDTLGQEFADYRVLDRRSVTLPNDVPGAVLDVEIADPSFGGVTVRGKSVYAVAGGNGYTVVTFVLDEAYDDTTEAAMTQIAESLTIESA